MVDDTQKLGAVFYDPGNDRRVSGAQFLHMLDSLDFGAIGAAWAYDMETERWRYLLFTPMIDSKGPRWIYERLLRVFTRWRFPVGLTPLDVIVSSPREQAFRQFRHRSTPDMQTRAHAPTKDLPASFIGGTMFGSLVIYRMEVWNTEEDHSQIFNQRVEQLLAA